VLFAKELCSLLINLEAAIPGSAKEIANILTDKASLGNIKKVKEYLRSKRKKCGVARKAHTVN
jgi:CO dehydrogenase/acetyl-CoA synthase alpha subunit